MANYFIIGSMQLGVELFDVKNGQVTLHIDRDVMRKLWDTYYIPYVMGWFSSYGRFRSDDVKIGEIIALTGSTSAAIYFPSSVEENGVETPIEHLVIPTPCFQDGASYAVQQGAGMAVTRSTPEREQAAVTFLKWFTQPEQNLAFCCESGYLPVRKDAVSQTLLDEVIQEKDLHVAQTTYDSLVSCMETIPHTTLYTSKAFENGSAARAVLTDALSTRATQDRAQVKERLQQGMSLEEAAAPFVTDDAFDQWFTNFEASLKTAVFPNGAPQS